ncbi:MAG: ribonuclease P protein component [Bacteroidales bacterium]|nr:ribonuclease P protein component [Bacteroidales bacterium]
MAKQYGFSKSEKLKSVVRIEKLFTGGRSFWAYPFSVYYRICNDEGDGAGCQMLVSVSKHYFKHAVDRNRVKRLVREAYRLNKTPLLAALQAANVSLDFGIVYKSKEIADYKTVEAGVRQALERLCGCIEKG